MAHVPQLEVEVRAFLTDRQRDQIDAQFIREGSFVSQAHQTTIYYETPADVSLRVRFDEHGAAIIFKRGALHDSAREETEVVVAEGEVQKLDHLVQQLGYPVAMKWVRTRRTFHWRDVTATIDDTRGYGNIVELEQLVAKSEVAAVRRQLTQLLADLGLKPTSVAELNQRVAEYQANWRQLSGLVDEE